MASVPDGSAFTISMTGSEPYLSVVVTARNDDHGGNLLGRMQAFVNSWIGQSGRHGIHSELVLVEWNPPAGRPQLADALHWPEDRPCCHVRIIEVPEALHQRYTHAHDLPLYQMIAKNVGIRRANGRFILATNIDILFSDELAEFLSKQQLQPGRMYRIDRHDVMNQVPVQVSPEEQIAYCRTHLIRVNTRYGTFAVTSDGCPALHAVDIADPDSGLLFEGGWFPPERNIGGEIFRWASQRAEVSIERVRGALVFEIEPGPGLDGSPLEMEISFGGKSLGRFSADGRSRISVLLDHAGKLDLLAQQNGVPLDTDLRVLSFRATGFTWHDREFERTGPALRVTPIRSPGVWHLWQAGQEIIGRFATGGPLVTLLVPVSPRLRRILRYYVRMGGFTGMAIKATRHAAGRLLRRESGGSVKLSESAFAPVTSLQPLPKTNAPKFLHTNACGDFTLLAREHWFDLRAYPEFDLFSMNLDSVFCYSAHYGGAEEEVLREPMRIYHIEHSTGSGWTPEGQVQLFERLKARGLTFVDYPEVLGWAAQMDRLRSPLIFNHENWGLSDYELPETTIPRTSLP